MREWEFVGLMRDFFAVHEVLSRVFDRFRSGSQCFDIIADLVGDSDRCLLFRLKERCHGLFRTREPADEQSPREALFDLSVGSLFHEAMKLRENLYQQEIYAPQVEPLLAHARAETSELFVEFERVQIAGADRTLEAMRETELLLDQTRNQLCVLLVNFPENGLMARFLVEHPDEVHKVFGVSLDDLLATIFGNRVDGYRVAIRSYLHSAFYQQALDCLDRIDAGSSDDLTRLRHYSIGMSRFREGRYLESVAAIEDWLASCPEEAELEYIESASLAISRVHHLVPAGGEKALVKRAAKLAKDLKSRLSAPQV
jgi:hypothetical protein